ncbi:Natterin-4 [Holothuria leucospilota]|uniref:Natterin-4 n=1 Tax=Holothuria leucospilota TaxID=206669 RepID=A0A9Q1H447_HOLLE|nr:Natterin-4 [Holothuria leucospilota]
MAKILSSILLLFAVFHTFEGRKHTVIHNEDDLIGSCTKTCDTLPDRSDQFDCEWIDNCEYNRIGWTRGFVKCNWCRCDCTTPDDIPAKEEISREKIILTELDLWNTCEETCSYSGLQRTDYKGCSEIRDCQWNSNGWISGFVRCDYCKCDCIKKGYPNNYRIENVVYQMNDLDTSLGDSVNVGEVTVENHGNDTVTTSYTIKMVYTTETMWSSSAGIIMGSEVKITFDELIIEEEVTIGGEVSYDYTWGETRTETVENYITAQPTSPPHSIRQVWAQGSRYTLDVPYTADLVTVYDDGTEVTSQISGTLNQASVSKFHVVYGEIHDLPEEESVESDIEWLDEEKLRSEHHQCIIAYFFKPRK